MAKLSRLQFQEIKIDQLKGVTRAMGWEVTAQDLRGDRISLTIEMTKEQIDAFIEQTSKLATGT